MPLIRSIILTGTYRDSVFLMKMSREAAERSGASRVAAMMASPRNKEILARLEMSTAEVERARPDELAVVVEADAPVMDAAFALVREMLDKPDAGEECRARIAPRGLDEALEDQPAARMALISVPGEYARFEAAQALAAGLDVMLYSGGISLEDERSLKMLAASRGRLLMGPDCGTAVIGGMPLGFANKVRRGIMGIVGSSGTGIQEVSCLLDRCGLGISQAYGTGGRDLRDAVGGLSALAALGRLADDPATRMILVIGKDIGPQTRSRLLDAYGRTGKTVLVCYLGAGEYLAEERAGIVCARNLTELARLAARLEAPVLDISEMDQPHGLVPNPRPGLLRAIYSGGALCREAAETALPVFAAAGVRQDCFANFAMDGCTHLPGSAAGSGHGFLDMGAPEFTGGRPHPLLAPEIKMERIQAELCDPEVSVVLTDIVLGAGAASNQAAKLVRTRDRAAARSGGRSRDICLVTAVCGTEGDPVSRSSELAFLQQAGIVVAGSNAQAALLAAYAATGRTLPEDAP